MKLSLRINTPEDSSGDNDGDSTNNISDYYPDFSSYNIEALSRVLEEELEALYPASKNYEFTEISLTFTTPEYIKELNRDYRNVDEPTDVLSFPLLDESEPVGIPELPVLSLGDIVICPEEVRRFHSDIPEREALCLMIAHSFLHLLGYDHDTESNQASMWELQDSIKARILQEAF